MTKVVHLTSVHQAFDIRIYYKECSSLAAAGYEVTLIAQHDIDVSIGGVEIHAVPKARNQLERMTRTVIRICRAALNEAASLYHFHDPELIPIGIFLKLLGKRVIYDAHENVPEDILTKDYLPSSWRKWIAGIAGMVEHLGAACFDGVISVTPTICRRFPRGKTQLIRNFPMAEELIPLSVKPHEHRPHHLLYAGRICLERGIKEMVQALGLLPNDLEAKLVLAGTFTPQSLSERVFGMVGANRIDYRGWLARENLRQLLTEARIGLALFLPGPNHTDSYPNKLFEYMAAGIPVIASDFPLWREIVEKAGCGLLVDSLDPQAIAQAIQWLLEHPQEASAMGRKGVAAVATEFNWAKEAENLRQFYARLLA